MLAFSSLLKQMHGWSFSKVQKQGRSLKVGIISSLCSRLFTRGGFGSQKKTNRGRQERILKQVSDTECRWILCHIFHNYFALLNPNLSDTRLAVRYAVFNLVVMSACRSQCAAWRCGAKAICSAGRPSCRREWRSQASIADFRCSLHAVSEKFWNFSPRLAKLVKFEQIACC